MVPGARIELATPAFSGRRSTTELPRQLCSQNCMVHRHLCQFRSERSPKRAPITAPGLASIRQFYQEVENNRFAALMPHFWYLA